MGHKSNSNSNLILLLIILGVLAYLGFVKFKKGATFEDFKNGSGIEISDRCIAKNIEGRYNLSIITKEATYKPYEKQELELRYNFELSKRGCTIIGGEDSRKTGFSVLDTINHKRGNFQPDNKDVTINGEINFDSLIIDIYVKTDAPQDCKVRIAFPFSQDIIQVLEGNFTAKDCGLKNGTAKLKKK